MFTKDHRFVRVVELCVYLLVEIHAVSSDFHRINSSGFLLPMENATVEELIGFSSQVEAVARKFMRNASKLAPISSLPLSSRVYIRKDSKVNVFNWEFEGIHEHIDIGLVDSLLLSSVDSNE